MSDERQRAELVAAAAAVVEEAARLVGVPMSLVNRIYDLETVLLPGHPCALCGGQPCIWVGRHEAARIDGPEGDR